MPIDRRVDDLPLSPTRSTGRGQVDVKCLICGREFVKGDQVVIAANGWTGSCATHWDGTELEARILSNGPISEAGEAMVARTKAKFARWVEEGKTATIQ